MAGLYVFIFLVSAQIIFSVNAAPYFEAMPPEAEKMLKECNESFPIDMTYLQNLNDTGSFPEEENKTPKCFIRCVLMKAGLMDEEFTFDAPKLKEAFKDAKYPDMDNMIDMCIAKDTETKCRCNKAYLFIRCLMTEMHPKFERLEEGEVDDDDDGGSIKDMITGFLREMGSTVLTILSVLAQVKDVLSAAMAGK